MGASQPLSQLAAGPMESLAVSGEFFWAVPALCTHCHLGAVGCNEIVQPLRAVYVGGGEEGFSVL